MAVVKGHFKVPFCVNEPAVLGVAVVKGHFKVPFCEGQHSSSNPRARAGTFLQRP